ncbi:hypothetical protein M405DRAFT_868973, partial [Rhizopogon salebrosus TDB-379]
MPETDSKLDVWHFGARYVAVILQSSKSPYRSAVAADIMGAILKKHAEHGQPAEYWDLAFDKWAEKGVWSAAAQKVHQEQLKHVRKGCLERSVQVSSVTMLDALGHDFVLRRNVRVAFSRSEMTLFIKFTNGSHHLRLCNHVAKLYNTLQQNNATAGCELQVLPELRNVESSETFGLVMSDHAATFGGLLVKEENSENSLLQDSFNSMVDPSTGEDVDLALQASRDVIVNEWQIDPALLALPATGASSLLPRPPTKQKAACISLDSDTEGDAVSYSAFPLDFGSPPKSLVP